MPFNMPGTIRRPRTRQSKRTAGANRPQPTSPIAITAATKSGSVLTVTFNQPVGLKGVPQYSVGVAGADPLSAALTSPNVLALTFDAAITSATTVTIPYEEPAVRNSSGGFVATSTFPLS